MLCTGKWACGVPHKSQGPERVPRLHPMVIRLERGALAPPCLWVGCTPGARVGESLACVPGVAAPEGGPPDVGGGDVRGG